MVFESVVTDVLNRVLGDYVENLDSKQLKLGIWGGDVELKDLVLKPAALDDLDLPVQTVYGRLGKLVLKIPWKNLYGAAVEANIEGLYLLVVPNQQVVYDPEKEEKQEIKSKQDELQRIEDAKKKEEEKGKPKADDTFVEKLTTQIIKNVQLKITNIHIRYEDKVTHPNHPFAMGITLSNLSLETTDESWRPTIVQEMVTKIYKVVNLEGLAVYWNCNSALYANLPIVDLIYRFNNEIASRTAMPNNYQYLLGPINSSARLRLNPKPEADTPAFSIPKVHLNLEMEKLFIGISKTQYQDIIALAESMDRMSRGMPYRKFRPNVSYKGHYKQWWHFAYNCVLEDVKRRRTNWDWNHMKQHREMCKDYAAAYHAKLSQKKVSQEMQNALDNYEKKLDIINIVIIRQKIELEVARLGQIQAQRQSKSWFSSWWGSAKDEDKDLEESTDILKKFEQAMTPDEKSRLYKAIDYQENSAPVELPEAYVDNTCTFILRSLEIEVRDDLFHVPKVVSTELKGVKCRLDTRAATSAIKVAVNIDGFTVFGLRQDEFIPQLVSSETSEESHGALLDVLFETKPLDKTCGQRVHVTAKPLKVIYDAQTINKVVDVFRTPQSSALDQLSAAAESSLSNFKEMSATGLQHAIEQHTVLDLKIDLHAPYIIIPYGGKYTGVENVLVINLGCMKISSGDRKDSLDVRHLHARGAGGREILEEMIAQSYDKFVLEFTDLQIVLAQGGEDWLKYVNESSVTPLHLLSPVNLDLTIFKCLITDDPRLPLLKIRGQLPSISINITDVRLLLLVALATSIPFPEESPPEPRPLMKSSRSHGSSQSLFKHFELPDKPKPKKSIQEDAMKEFKGEFIQFTTLDVKFVMKEFFLGVSHQEMSSSPSEGIADFKITSLEFDLIQQTFNTDVIVRLGGITCSQFRKNDSIDIISTPLKAETGDYLFIVKFTQVDKKSPEFHSKHQSCESKLNLEFSSLNMVLHQEGLQSLLKFTTELQMQVEDLRKPSSTTVVTTTAAVTTPGSLTSVERMRRMSSVAENFVAGVRSSKNLGPSYIDRRATKPIVVETIQFKLNAQFQELMVLFACDKYQISSCAIKGIKADVIVKKSYTQVIANLHGIDIIDLNQRIHRNILTVSSEEAINAQIVMYNTEHNKQADPNSVDMSVKATLGCLRIVFLNNFVVNMLDFLNEFQTAQQAIIDASQAAAQTAKQNMQTAYENATRISLNIDLKAPDIIVPVSSQSYDALLLDMGFITISNRFITLDIKNDQNQNAVLDELKLKLTNFSLARIKLDNESRTVTKCPLLQPVTFSLHVKRNLSTSWYNVVPDIDLSGKLDTITLLLSQTDYQMIMNTLSGNLSEGKQQSVPTVPSKNDRPFVSPKSTETTLLSSKDSKTSANQPKVHTSVKFTFTMESFIINLFTGGSKTLSSPAHDPKNALVRFQLEVLSIKGRILSDNSIVTSVLLVNCLMDDMRKGREKKLTRLIERKHDSFDVDVPADSASSESVAPVRSMIDITFQLKDNDMFADVRVYSFTLILSVDYLLKIADFFTGMQPSEEASKAQKARSASSIKDTSSSRTSAKSAAITEKESTMTVNLRIEKPDIVLVEHMDNIDANALILNTEILMKLRMAGAHQVISGSINDIQLYTCCYDPARRAETRGAVLHPVSISVAGSTPEGQGLHIEVCITDILINVSPSTIELLNRVYSTMYGGDATKTQSDFILNDYSDIWEYKPYVEDDFWFLKAETAEDAFEYIGDAVTEEASVSTLFATPKVKELCIVSLSSLIITLEAGVGNKTLPMLLLQSSFQGTVNDWSSQLSVDASLTLQVGYYNSRLALWEPLIEPVALTNETKTTYVPWELKLEV
ncbi:hypothetical protein ILUMI_02321 [Ignelater luminosus]|uniref:Vacuolar protein sorting-associated protein 13 n=1 Tax=Ignelater luminosus TaxID=2038154 RepID=A0A8K0DIG7_IGNLU|nr:hypothetical protein ILUMI_02321 [Ignelater luminosus]